VAEVAPFLAEVLADYERQWSEALGHQQRHPLRVKMERIKELAARGLAPADFERVLSGGVQSEDPGLTMLCLELLPRWRARAADASGNQAD
jgi:hypothetical protein